MNAIAIPAPGEVGMNALGLLGAVPGKWSSRGVPSFINLFDSLESLAKPVMAKTAVTIKTVTAKPNPALRATAATSEASSRIAAAMIRSMLGPAPTIVPTPDTRDEQKDSKPVTVETRAATDSDQELVDAPVAANQNTLIGAVVGLKPAAPPAMAPAQPGNGADVADAKVVQAVESAETAAPEAAIEDFSEQIIPAAPARTIAPQMSIENFESSVLPVRNTIAAANPPAVKNSRTRTEQTAPAVTTQSAASPADASAAVTMPVIQASPMTAPRVAVEPKSSEPVEAVAPEVAQTLGNARQTVPVSDAAPVANEPAPTVFTAVLTAAVEATPEISKTPVRTQPEVAEPAVPADPAAPVEPSAKLNDSSASSHDDRPPQQQANTRETRTQAAEPQDSSQPKYVAASVGQDFSRPVVTNPALVISQPTNDAPTPAPATRPNEPAQPAQVTETSATATPSTPSQPVQEIAVRIARPELPAVDLHVSERAGEIHVAVRTQDVELQTSLRQELGTLSSSLERAGYHTETFVPRAAAGSQMNLREDRPAQQGFSGRGGSQSESEGGKQKGQRERRGTSWLEELENAK